MDINEFVQRLGTIQAAYPIEAEDALKKGSQKMLRKIKAASPDSGQKHGRKIKNSWHLKMTGLSAADIQANIYSTSPHFHLVECGHVIKTLGGRVKGFKQGSHFFERAVNQNLDEIQSDIAEKLFKAVSDKL